MNASPIPGTVHLVDLDGTMLTKHDKGKKEVVLIPPPSSNPNDPLNWSPKRKVIATACVCLYTLAVGFPSAAIYSVLVPISINTGIPIATLNDGTGYMFLFFGWGCAIWQPLALQYGKRPVYLFSVLATLGLTMWGPYAKTNGQWIASKILQGFFGAPIESLCEISMADIHFTHNRGSYMTLYAFFLAGSNYIAPVFAGFIADGQGWRWVLYWCAIFLGLVFILLFFFMEETNYDRPAGAFTVVMDEISEDPIQITPNEKTNSSKNFKPQNISSIDSTEESSKNFWQKLSMKDKPRPFKQFIFILKQPFTFFTFPVVVYAGFAYGSSLIWFNVLNATTSLILSSPPYNFKPSMVGLSYLSPFLGSSLSTVWSGMLGDRIILAIARRHKGRMEPEDRLWLFTLTALFCPVGLILWGVGAAHEIHWFGLIVATFILAASIFIAIPVSCNYVIDTYQQLSGQAMVTVIIVRNTMSFVINYGITPWVRNTGLRNCFVAAAFISLAQSLVFLLFVKWGKRMRIASKDRYWKMVNESATMGCSH
ncbi:major facilitator superfamily domain-containing protein [Tricladium varicosporioides]|nr:major facilitator superfamily domain-containing protein [Hymenoscyphus varicosporioides]